MPAPEVATQREEICFRLAIDRGLVVVVDRDGVKRSYLEWAIANTELTQEVFDYAKGLLCGSGPALEGWLALAERKREEE